MRKKTFLKAVSIFACLSILMLSAPGAIAYPRTEKKTYTYSYHRIMQTATMLFSFLPFLNLSANDEKGDTSSNTVSHKYSGKKIKTTGGLLRAMLGRAN